MKNKRGQFGLDAVKPAAVILLAIGLTMLIGILIFGVLDTSALFNTQTSSGNFINNTITFATGAGSVPADVSTLTQSVALTITLIDNSSQVIPATNYSTSGSAVIAVAGSPWLSSSVNVTGSWVETQDTSTRVLGNYSAGVDNFTNNIPTIFLILGILVVIIVLTVLVRSVGGNAFGSTA